MQAMLSEVLHLTATTQWVTKLACIYTIICLESVGVRKLQVAILAVSPREMYLIDRILPRYILSRVLTSSRLSSAYNFFIREKTQTRVARMLVISMDPLCGQLTELEIAEPTQLGGVALRRRDINVDVSGCVVQGSECKPHAGNNICFHFYFLRLTRLTLNKSY